MKLLGDRTLAALSPNSGQQLVAPAEDITIAFAFDIDGVLVKGTHPLPHARETIFFLQKSDIPFIFLTNGGGLLEAAHAEKLGSRLTLPISPKQFVQSHSPYHDLVDTYADKPILVLGGEGDKIRNVARGYGFNKVITSSDIFALDRSNHPFPEISREYHERYGRQGEDIENIGVPLNEVSIAAILVWSSPRDWCFDLQVALDLLLSAGGKMHTRSELNGNHQLPNNGYLQDGQPKLFFCNPDFEWATQAAQSRLAQGAWKTCMLGLWDEATNGTATLPHTTCGKPTTITYEYGESVLKKWNEQHRLDEGAQCHSCNSPTFKNGASLLGAQQMSNGTEHPPKRNIKTVYMIGDNPESDIAGANAFESQYGYRWKSILVETGVYASGTKPTHKPTHIAKDVEEAVAWALQQEGYSYLQEGEDAE